MKKVQRDEIVDCQTYEDTRDAFRDEVMEAKRLRRVHVGDNLTFLFENRLTVRYQVQEMMRAEQIVREAEIAHELETYNELIGGPGGLGCTLLIEIDDEQERAVKLREWLDLPRHLYARVGDKKIRPVFDERQVGTDRVSSVQYLQFELGGEVPEALGADHPSLAIEVELDAAQRAALAEDLIG